MKDSDYPHIYINGTEQTTGFTIDYQAGSVTFDTALTSTDTVTVDYSYATTSKYTFEPLEGKILRIYRVESQFSAGATLNDSIIYEVFAGTNSVYKSKYRTAKDFLNTSNLGVQIAPFGELTKDIIILPWDYGSSIDLKSSLGMRLEIYLENDIPYSNTEIGTVSLYALVEEE